MRARQSVLVDGRAGRPRTGAWDVSSRHSALETKKALVFSNTTCHEFAGDRDRDLAMPESSTTLWATCGRRERENRRTEIADLRPPSSFDVTVKGIPVFGTASLFAGRRSNEDLGRSVVLDAGLLPPSRGAPMTADVRRPPRRGTTSAGATKRRQPSSMEQPSSLGDASFTRSFDPFTFTSRQHRG
jgi:hypothetical protein